MDHRILKSLAVPPNSMIALIGCAGSGKSTVTAMFPAPWVLSADQYREDVADDAGDQSAGPDAWNLLYARLDARLRRGLPAVVDATSAAAHDRAQLLAHAARHQAPAVALVLDTPLDDAQRRNAARPANRRVPAAVVAEQHAQIAAAQLMNEGFARVIASGELLVLPAILRRLVEQHGAVTGQIEAVFGAAAARLITWDEQSHDPEFATATLAAGGEELRLRYMDDGDPYDQRFEALAVCETAGCPGPAWTAVHGLGQLAAAQSGQPENEVLCVQCDDY